MKKRHKILLVSNFNPNEGYAWNKIEAIFLAISEFFFSKGSEAVTIYRNVHPETVTDIAMTGGVREFNWNGSSLPELYRFLRYNRITAVYLTDYPLISVRYLVSRMAGVEYIVNHIRYSGAGDTCNFPIRTLKKILAGTSAFSADRVIVISEFVKKRTQTFNFMRENKLVLMHNAVDMNRHGLEDKGYVYDRYNIPRGKKIIFCGARAKVYKGIEVFIEAADLLIRSEMREDMVFLYCGHGPDLRIFKDIVSEKGLEKYFIFGGKTDEVERILCGVTISVVPSLWDEGFGNAAIDAMASAVPVIASKVGGLAEVITDGENGYYFEKGDSRRLAELIKELADDETKRRIFGENARKVVEEKYNLADKMKDLEKIFVHLF